MKIGVDIRVLMDSHYSGVSQYTANLLSALLELDKRNEYRLFYNSFRNIEGRLSVWRRDNASLVSRRIPNKIFNYILEKIIAWPKLDRAVGGADIFWSPHFNFSRFSRATKNIITVHDLSFLRYPHFFSCRKNFWHRALAVKEILRRAAHIIAVSESTKNDIVELVGIAPEKISVIYAGHNLSRSKEAISGREADDFLQSKKITSRFLLYLGNLEPRKNLVGLIKAYDMLRAKGQEFSDLRLVLAGAPGWSNKRLYRAWRQSPYQSDIIFLGYISQKEKEILYSRASVFVYPSFYEGFGFPPLEALSYGLPVVCSNVSSLPEVVGSAALMIDPYQPGEIAAAIQEILTHDDLRNSLIEQGRQIAANFSWEKTARAYQDIFNKL